MCRGEIFCEALALDSLRKTSAVEADCQIRLRFMSDITIVLKISSIQFLARIGCWSPPDSAYYVRRLFPTSLRIGASRFLGSLQSENLERICLFEKARLL